jgi:catechol 2,3-dioxygenase-like lactoylglutathione lyase family enzyme
MTGFPRLRHVVLDATDVRALAEFYRELFSLCYREGHEPEAGDREWLVLRNPHGGVPLAFQQVSELTPATWPDGPIPQQLHVDATVESVAELDRQHERALALGARLLRDDRSDSDEAIYVYADPAGHPFCIFVAE